MPESSLYSDLKWINPGGHNGQPVKDFLEQWWYSPAIAVTTSGSTGTPKTMTLSKAAMVESARQTIAFFDITPGQTLLLCLPVDFIAGKMMVVRALVSGATLCYCEPSSNPFAQTENIPPVDFAAFTPQQVAAIISDPASRQRFSQIKKIIIGGGEIPPELEKKLAGFSNEIYATYGMTETITHIAVRRIGNADRIYKVFKGIRIGLDARGCLTIQAPYLGNAPIVTNDVVDIQGPHEFSWLGRFDNVVNSGGIKLFPEKTEEKIRDLVPQEFFVAGIPHPTLGQQLVLVIEAEPYDAVTLGLLRSSLKDVLDKYEVPGQIFFVQPFARTGTGKIKRSEVLARIG